MPIEEKDIAKVAQLAHLDLGEEELKVFGPQIAGIIDYVEQLNQLDTANVPPALGRDVDRSHCRTLWRSGRGEQHTIRHYFRAAILAPRSM